MFLQILVQSHFSFRAKSERQRSERASSGRSKLRKWSRAYQVLFFSGFGLHDASAAAFSTPLAASSRSAMSVPLYMNLSGSTVHTAKSGGEQGGRHPPRGRLCSELPQAQAKQSESAEKSSSPRTKMTREQVERVREKEKSAAGSTSILRRFESGSNPRHRKLLETTFAELDERLHMLESSNDSFLIPIPGPPPPPLPYNDPV